MFTPIAVMEMLTHLHQLGYQRLRLSAGMSPNGMSWRYSVAPVEQFKRDGFLLKQAHYPGVAFGSSRGDDAPFDWEVSEELGPDQLAALFLENFPMVAAAGKGDDGDYATWLAETLGTCRPDGAPIMYGEYVDAAADGYIKTGNGSRVPLPPRHPADAARRA